MPEQHVVEHGHGRLDSIIGNRQAISVQLNELPLAIEQIMVTRSSDAIRAIRERQVFNVGHSAQAGAEALQNILADL